MSDSPPHDTISQPSAPATYTFGARIPKVLYLLTGLALVAIGMIFHWEILGRIWLGEIATARISEIRVNEPGQPERIYNYRRIFAPEQNLAITFQHYVSILVDGRPERFRISVDSRRAPIEYYNVNDEVTVAYYPHDPERLAFDFRATRTWGAGAIFSMIGALILMTGVPMFLATFRPIEIDPEAPTPPTP